MQFSGKVVRSVRPLAGGADLGSAEIEPELITNLFDSAREKRRPVRYEDLPPLLVQAILSAEDKRFFEHPGFDFIRIFGAAWADIRHSQHLQGASTITMQVARTFFLSTDRTWRRKLAEAMLSLELEQRFNKQQIFELYANEVYLGNRGSFGVRGFAEASEAYFGKDLRQLTLPECTFLAGLIRAPNYYSASDRHPERAAQARDRVLTQMLENKYINEADVQDAKRVPIKIVRTAVAGNEAPYFVDMVKDHLLDNYSEQDLLSQNYRVYTTLDPQLQRAAAAAVDARHEERGCADCQEVREGEEAQGQKRPQRTGAASTGGAGGPRSPHRRDQGADRRARLWPEPVEPRAGAPPARVGL